MSLAIRHFWRAGGGAVWLTMTYLYDHPSHLRGLIAGNHICTTWFQHRLGWALAQAELTKSFPWNRAKELLV